MRFTLSLLLALSLSSVAFAQGRGAAPERAVEVEAGEADGSGEVQELGGITDDGEILRYMVEDYDEELE